MDERGLMRRAVVDIGTNTFNLLIADCKNDSVEVVHSEKRGVSIGMGGINEGRITEEAMTRALKALKEFESAIQHYKVENVKLIATSAVRDADNSAFFKERVKSEIGRDLVVIDGLEEANYIFKGVSLCCSFDNKSMIMDIGGGSTEFILADYSGIIELVSLDIGVSRLFQMFQCSDPFTEEDIREIEAFIENKSDGFFEAKEVGILIGSSGTFETFYELINKRPFPHGDQTIELELEPFLLSLDELIASTLEERNQNDFIIPIRKKMAPYAAVKTRWVLRQLNVQKVLISPFSLKEGALQ